jgi:hypothetical protein
MSLQVAQKFRHLVSNTPEFQNLVGAATPAAAAARIVSWLEDPIDAATPLPLLSIYPGATDWTKVAEPGCFDETGTIEFKFFMPPPPGGDDAGGEFEAVRDQVTEVIKGILKLTGRDTYMDLNRISIGEQMKSARDRAERFWVVDGAADWGVTG